MLGLFTPDWESDRKPPLGLGFALNGWILPRAWLRFLSVGVALWVYGSPYFHVAASHFGGERDLDFRTSIPVY
nr:MAG: hypothetical protein H1Bulk291116_000001 [Mitovirus sp.]